MPDSPLHYLYPTAILAICKPVKALHSQNVMYFEPIFLVEPRPSLYLDATIIYCELELLLLLLLVVIAGDNVVYCVSQAIF
jgi:hypothetical protein